MPRSRLWIGALSLVCVVVVAAAWLAVREPERAAVAPPTASALEDGGGEGRSRPVARFPGRGFEVAGMRRGTKLEVLDRPGGGLVERLGARTEFGSQRVLPVIDGRKRWLGIAAPELGNGEVGWVRYDPATLALGSTRVSLEVDLSERRLELRRDERVTQTAVVSVGRLGSGTPAGRFAVTDLISGARLSPVYGSGAIALSARQPNLPPGWVGGDRLAIHGWGGPVGDAASGGCLRASNEDVETLLERVPLGAPVFIRA